MSATNLALSRRLIILLPAYNEGPSVGRLVKKLVDLAGELPMRLTVIACDDGSLDETGEVLHKLAAADPRIVVLSHKINRGLGETARDLFEAAAELAADDDVIVRLDCDDTHEPIYITHMLAKLDEGSDVVIASRFQPGGGQHGVDGYRAFISVCANLFMKLFFPIRNVREYSCAFRAYRGRLVREAIRFYGNDFIQLKGFGFACTLEKLVKLHLLDAKFAEIPFELRYDQKLSDSKMVGSITALGYLVMTVLYHWPWGGWRRYYRNLRASAARST